MVLSTSVPLWKKFLASVQIPLDVKSPQVKVTASNRIGEKGALAVSKCWVLESKLERERNGQGTGKVCTVYSNEFRIMRGEDRWQVAVLINCYHVLK